MCLIANSYDNISTFHENDMFFHENRKSPLPKAKDYFFINSSISSASMGMEAMRLSGSPSGWTT